MVKIRGGERDVPNGRGLECAHVQWSAVDGPSTAIGVELVKKVGGQEAFSKVGDLVKQIAQDVADCRDVLSTDISNPDNSSDQRGTQVV